MRIDSTITVAFLLLEETFEKRKPEAQIFCVCGWGLRVSTAATAVCKRKDARAGRNAGGYRDVRELGILRYRVWLNLTVFC